MSIRAAVNDVSVRLGAVQALDTVSLTVEPGQFLALLGPSGSGKTTTLNVLAGFVKPDQGTVTFDDKDVTGVPPHRRDLGIVFQGYALFPHMTVAQNVEFPLRMRGIASAQRRQRAQQALELVGLDSHAKRMTTTLSGGQRQRVALARAVVFEPRVMLLDEPLAALDKQLRDSMQHELKALQRRLGVTTVAVTHDQVEALTMADKVAVLCDGEVEQLATPQDLYLHPATIFVAKFLGEANLIPVDHGQLQGFGPLPGQPDGTAVIRPEHITITAHPPHDNQITTAATIEDVTFQGARLRARARLDASPDTALTIAQPSGPASQHLQHGTRAHLTLDPQTIHVIPNTATTEEAAQGGGEKGARSWAS
jgi:putative spermidine/putrescine transport system ATP-binding protein